MAALYRQLAPEFLAAGLPEPLYKDFMSGRYLEFERRAEADCWGHWQHQVEQCLSYMHFALARAFLRDGAHCCARTSLLKLRQLQPRDSWVGQALESCLPRQSLPNVEEPGLPCGIEPLAVKAWKRRLRRWQGRRVGLLWAPSPLTLQAFASLSAPSGVRFFGLQQGPHQIQSVWPPDGMPFVDLAGFLEDSASLAGLLYHLDLLISVEPRTAQLAAALGRPVWLLGMDLPGSGANLRCFPGADWESIVQKVCTNWYRFCREKLRPYEPRGHAKEYAATQ